MIKYLAELMLNCQTLKRCCVPIFATLYILHIIMPWKTIPDKGALLHFASQVNLLSPVAGLHVALTANKDEERR